MVERMIKRLSPRAEFALVLTICFALPIVFSISAMLSGRLDDLSMSTGDVVITTLINLLTLTLFALVLRLRGKSLAGLAGRPSGWALLAGVPLLAADLLLYWTLSAMVVALNPRAEDIFAFEIVDSAPFAVMLVFIVVNSFVEELPVTGYIITALEREGALFAITASTFVRFLYHLYQGPVASISILPLGLLFGAVYWYTRNLWPLLVAHTLMNLVVAAYTMPHGR